MSIAIDVLHAAFILALIASLFAAGRRERLYRRRLAEIEAAFGEMLPLLRQVKTAGDNLGEAVAEAREKGILAPDRSHRIY